MGSNYYLGGNVTNHDTIKALRDALTEARSSLVHSYNVTDYPADGETAQDKSIANIDRVLALTADASEDAPGDCRRCRSYATLVKAKESQLAHVQAEAAKGREAIATLASEREANAMLTAELAARPAPVGAVQAVDLDDALSAVLWLYHRLPRGYEAQPHIERVVRALAGATCGDADTLLRELGRAAAPAAPITKGSKND